MGPAGKFHSGGRNVFLLTVAVTLLCWSRLPVTAGTATLADRILRAYDTVDSVSCDIRRTWQTLEGEPVRMNSRVHWHRPRRLHVENFSPVPRRYVCDGEQLYYHVEGNALGFSRPVDALDPAWRLRLEVVPGSPMEYLLPLQGLPETALESGKEGLLRRGMLGPEGYAVLLADAEGRLLEFKQFADREDATPVFSVIYSRHQEVLPGVWIPMQHETRQYRGSEVYREWTRVSLMEVNQPVDPRLFDPAPYFGNLEFVDSFEKIVTQ